MKLSIDFFMTFHLFIYGFYINLWKTPFESTENDQIKELFKNLNETKKWRIQSFLEV